MRSLPLILAFASAFAGCKSNEDSDPSESDTDTDTDADADADTDTDTDADTDTDDTDTDDPCWVTSGTGQCWDCELPAGPEADSAKALNQCADPSISSAPFDNAARIPASTWVPGTPLPLP